MSILHLELTNKKAKEVSQLLANDTARRIMDTVSEESKSESEIAKKLSIPLSTVHYNMQRLLAAGLVLSEEYTYSEKGKEVRHYKLKSQHVVITTAPLAALPQALTGLGLSVAVAAMFFINTRLFSTQSEVALQAEVAPQAARMMMAESAPIAADQAVQAATQQPALWPYILLGAVLTLVGIYVAYLIQRHR